MHQSVIPNGAASYSSAPLAGYQTYYGHHKVIATKCWHEIHPASSQHTPWCPACVVFQTRERLDIAQRNLLSEGGLARAEETRNRSWNTARMRHEIAKQRLERVRQQDQLRWEREQAWDEAHQQHDSQRLQTAIDSGGPMECSLCMSVATGQMNDIPRAQIASNVAWWECPGALAIARGMMPHTPPPSRNRRRKPEHQHEGSEALHMLIQSIRGSKLAMDLYSRAWKERRKTESAVRQKHGLGEHSQICSGFWDVPIPGCASLRNHQQNRELQRMAERKARGNTTKPRPPCSPLSQSKSSEGWDVDLEWLEASRREEERAWLERAARRVGEEVGYLYFVGDFHVMEEWRDDFMRSNRDLVFRERFLNSETSGSEDSEDGDDKIDDTDDIDMMDIDVP